MEPELHYGWEVIIDLDASPREGDIVVAVLDGYDLQVRTLLAVRDESVVLGCENPAYPPTEVEDLRIIGVVVQIGRPAPRGKRRRP